MVVMDRKECIDKATYLLSQPAYRTIDKDSTNRLGAKFITLLRKLKRETGLEDHIYKYMYPMGCSSPKFYGFLKIYNANTTLRPMVSGRGSVTYDIAKVLAKVLMPLVGQSPYHVHSTKDFEERVSKVTLQPQECLCSYDVTALFTSVPVNPALNIIQGLLEQDTSLHSRTVLLMQNIIQLLGFCLPNTHFSFQGQFYEQVEGAAVGYLICIIVANLNMEHFQRTALVTPTTPPGFGLDVWITPLSSNRKTTNRTLWNILTMWTLSSSLPWITTTRMGLYLF